MSTSFEEVGEIQEEVLVSSSMPESINPDNFSEKLKELQALDEKKDALSAELKSIARDIEYLSYKLAEYMNNTGITKITVDNRTFTYKEKIYTKIVDQPALFAWLEENKAHNLLMAINAQKLNGYCRERLESQEDLPPGVDPTFIKRSINIK